MDFEITRIPALYLSHNGLLEPLGQSQVMAYLRGLSRHYNIKLITYNEAEDRADTAGIPLLSLTFRENCPDLRNIRVVDIIRELGDYGAVVDVHDPWADSAGARAEYCLELIGQPARETYDGVILAVAHDTFRSAGSAALRSHGRDPHVFCDLKSVFDRDLSDLRL